MYEKNDRIIYLTIYEGKYHQVKRMLEAINNKVTYLKRVKMNNLELDETLKKGEYRKLSNDDVRYIRQNYIPRDKEFGERALARKYGLGHSSLNRIINKQCYKNVD